MEFWHIQALGFLAFIVSICSYQFKNQKTMYAIRILNDCLWALHYYLLNAPIVALTLIISLTRAWLSIFVWPTYKAYFIIAGLVLIFAITIKQTTGVWFEYLPFISTIVFSIAVYFHDHYTVNRMLMLLGAFIWLVIGFCNHSYPDILSSTVNMLSIGIAFYRHKRLKIPAKPHA